MAFMDSKLPGSRRRFHFGAFLSAALSILLASFVVSCSGSSSRDDSGLSGDFREACLRGEITVYGEAPIYTSTASALDKAKEDLLEAEKYQEFQIECDRLEEENAALKKEVLVHN